MRYSRQINSLIMSAMKAGEKVKSETYKSFKAEMLKAVTAKGAVVTNINDLPDANEVTILNKMIKERTDSANVYESNGRKDLAEAERIEAGYLAELLPKAASAEEIQEALRQYIEENGDFEQKQMGAVVKYIKGKFENVDGAVVAKTIKDYLNK